MGCFFGLIFGFMTVAGILGAIFSDAGTAVLRIAPKDIVTNEFLDTSIGLP